MVSSNSLGRPKSELLFERFCRERGVKFERIPVVTNVKGMRTPDYMVFPAGERIVVEIAQLDPNDDDRQHSGKRKTGSIGVGGEVGKRIRLKITAKAGQLKARSAGVLPAVLVLYHNTETRRSTAPEPARRAMFGFDPSHIVVPADPSSPNVLVDRRFGKKANM